MKVTTAQELRERIDTRELPTMPAPTVYPNGRIGWPAVVEYDVELGADVVGYESSTCADPVASRAAAARAERLPFPPKMVTHRAPDGFWQKRNNDTTPVQMQPATMPWRVVIHDLARYELLVATGATRDPRHTGATAREATDNRRTS